METYALFEDASASRIVFEFFTPSPTDDPVRLACVGIEDPGVVHSAQIGCLSAYHLLSRQGYIKPGEHFFPSCQFGEAQVNLRARGSSAGLAFCLKFAGEALKQATGASRGFSLAATGVIENGSCEAAVGRVEGLEGKVRAALAVLGKGDLLFIPAVNAGEIPDELKAALEGKGVGLRPVGTVAEALAVLAPPIPHPEKAGTRRPGRRLWLIATAILGISAGSWWLLGDGGAELENLFQQGRYLEAKARLEERLDQRPGDVEATHLHQQLASPLDLKVGLSYLEGGSRGLRPGSKELVPGRQALALKAGDLYRFSYEAGDSCYLYVVQRDAKGSLRLLAAQPLGAGIGQRYFLPGDTRDWFRIEAGDMGGSVYVVAARRPGYDLEQLWRKYQGSAGSDQEQYRRDLAEHLERRHQANAGGLAGVFYAQVELTSSASNLE